METHIGPAQIIGQHEHDVRWISASARKADQAEKDKPSGGADQGAHGGSPGAGRTTDASGRHSLDVFSVLRRPSATGQIARIRAGAKIGVERLCRATSGTFGRLRPRPPGGEGARRTFRPDKRIPPRIREPPRGIVGAAAEDRRNRDRPRKGWRSSAHWCFTLKPTQARSASEWVSYGQTHSHFELVFRQSAAKWRCPTTVW
jgi:hypothetical protein